MSSRPWTSARRSRAGDLASDVARSVRREWVLLGALLLSLGAIHVWWLRRFRQGFPLDIDESGYLWFSFTQHDALREDGILGLWRQFQGEGWAPPLLPSLTALVELSGGARQIVPSIAVQLVFLVVLTAASYGIGRRLLDRRAGFLTAVVVSTLPAITDFVRTYHMVIPSTAMYTLATYALLASNRLRSRPWALAWGVSLGSMLLSRTMMVAFLPALPVAAAWMLVVDRADVRRVVNLFLGLLALAVTSSLWYANSWHPILDYLLRAGYGDESSNYGPGLSPGSTEYWTHELTGAVNGSLYVLLAGVLLAAFVLAGAGVLVDRSRWSSWRAVQDSALRAARSDVIVPLFVVVEGYLALTSSRNDGTGFVVPLLPPLIALAVVAALRTPWRAARAALGTGLAVVAVFNVVMKADIASTASRVRTVDVPMFGLATLTNGQGYLHQHLVHAAGYRLGPPTRWLPDRDRRWLGLYDSVVSQLHRLPAGVEPRTYLALSDPLLNASALRLAAYRSGCTRGVFDYVQTDGDDTVAAYREVLSAAEPDLLVTSSRQAPGFGPPISQPLVEEAAASLGFEVVDRLGTPDGRELRVWRRGGPRAVRPGDGCAGHTSGSA